ncbi:MULTISPECIES: gephyrin-like molybdotransferase Glp [Psychrobacter]|jgi:molybdopterin molybdotransferase|uniref:molybdopterin molybdotransferase MoeA n=1 Tax=Psychrobacter TaxID=497 RepID=UPI00188C4D47|nr:MULTISPECIES: gephyrin-like molybdotransferase Glp [Psychrobacter]MBF4489719.1 molybdopterin molybdotransferase MoeA [Psychrobacter sp. N25K4-3-2]MCH1783750.1 molybdopterin molybdotransferase MoeA [Psychrobacter glaciei]
MITMEALQAAIKLRVDTYNNNDFPLPTRVLNTCELLDSRNQILAQDITATFDIPRQNLSAMDGYAIAHGSDISNDSSIQIIGESQAGSAYTGDLTVGQGVRIFTGAVVPDSCDTVIMQENTNFATIRDSIDKSKPYTVTLSQTAQIDSNIRKQGEEIESGEAVLKVGKRLNATDISLLANLGVSQVKVFQPLIVGLLATGDELVAIGNELTSLAQIYNSNTPTLKTMLADLPMTIRDYGIIPDNLEQTTAAVHKAMQDCDVLISTAGVSVGDYDFLTTVIEQLGQINHYKVAMKPGKPFVFGELNKDTAKPVLYFGLPGNPLSTVVGALQFVIPALWQMSGADLAERPMQLSVKATLTNDIRKSAGRKDFQRGVLTQNDAGSYQVECFSGQQSHRIKQLSRANCFVVLDKDSGNVASGDSVIVQPFPWLHA